MPTLHSPSRLSVAFDDDHSVANASLALAGLLSEKLGLEELCEETISIAPFPGRRVATLVHLLTELTDRSFLIIPRFSPVPC